MMQAGAGCCWLMLLWCEAGASLGDGAPQEPRSQMVPGVLKSEWTWALLVYRLTFRYMPNVFFFFYKMISLDIFNINSWLSEF